MANVIEPSTNPCYVVVLRDNDHEDSWRDFAQVISDYVSSGWVPAGGINNIHGLDTQALYYKDGVASGL